MTSGSADALLAALHAWTDERERPPTNGCVATEEQKLREKGGRSGGDSMDVILDELKCPISQQLFQEPVTAADGHTYERAAIEEHIREVGKTSPVTGEALAHSHLTPNHVVLKLISMDHLGDNDSQYQADNMESSFFG